MADDKQMVDTSTTPTPMIDRNAPQPEARIPMNLLPVDQVPVEQAPEEQPEAQEPPTEQPIVATPPIQSDIDPYTGKPWREIALEEKRKREELADRLPQMIDEKLSKVSQSQQPTYTYEQLEAYKLQNATDANIVAWASGEQRKMQTAENRKLFEEVVGSREKVNQIENQKQQSLSYVQNTYPEAFKRDAQGRPMQWDESSPITQQIFGLMKNPDLSNNPNGLAAAADIAYGRVMRTQAPVLQQKVQQAKADVKQAQKSSLTEGAGRRVVPSAPAQQTAVDTLRKTGNIKDAESAMGAVLRARGIIVD